ncbi:hypothetical protein KCG43_03360 [Photobacterium sp. WH24]|uniref:hypothetical protein n=1 Tax=Photobacterium sp. WH24 TaxID=2827237 RepID=UPI001C453156|nr:hypothetical protein [Photobacterium sp. WH24]MBV7261061.1 hypothetical protein [Photobacterium sp. WH24]
MDAVKRQTRLFTAQWVVKLHSFIEQQWRGKLLYFGAQSAVVLAVLLLLVWSLSPVSPVATMSAYNQVSCRDIGAAQGRTSATEPLRVFTPVHQLALPILKKLCSQPAIQSAYAGVSVFWQSRSEFVPAQIYSQFYDVMWGRDYVLNGMSPSYLDYYQPVLILPSYDVYWYARSADFRGTKDDFTQLTLGLLDDPFSLSGYQLPMNQLNSLQLAADSVHIAFYPSRQALAEALLAGQVDVVADTSFSTLSQSSAVLSKVMIASQVYSGAWYASSRVSSPQSIIAIKDGLSSLR